MNYKTFFSPTLGLLLLVMLMNSCSSTRNYGDKHERLDKTRIENSRTPQRGEVASQNTSRETYNTKKQDPSKTTTKDTTSPKASSSVSIERQDLVTYARTLEGTRYKYAGRSPQTGFDCSGFVSYVCREKNIDISGPSGAISKKGKAKDWKDLEEGDLLFFGKNGRIDHVGMVYSFENGELKMIHSSTSRGVVVESITTSAYWRPRFQFARDVIESPL